jgi:hypothetical protein
MNKYQHRKSSVSYALLAALLLGSGLIISHHADARGPGKVELFQYAHNTAGTPASLYAEELLPAVHQRRQVSMPLPKPPFLSSALVGLAASGPESSNSIWNISADSCQQLSAAEEERSTFEEVVLTVVGVGAYIAIQGANVWASKEIDQAFGY